MDIGKILGKLPWMSKIPLQGNGMAAIPKNQNALSQIYFLIMERKLFRAEHFNHLKYIVIRATKHETFFRKREE